MAEGFTRNHNCTNTEVKSIWDIDEIDDMEPHSYYSRIGVKRNITPAKSFTCKDCNLNAKIIEGLRHLNVVYPNYVQKYVLPLTSKIRKEEEDVLICAKRESGKTTIAIASLLQVLSVSDLRRAKAIIICPKCDIAEHTFNMGNQIAKFSELSLRLEIRSKANKNRNIVEQIVVGTPKRIENIIKLKLLDIENVGTIVIDDAHLIFENDGHEHSLLQILDKIPQSCNLVFMCSTPPKEILLSYENLIHKLMNKRFHPLIVEFPIPEVKAISCIKPKFIQCSDVTKRELLRHVIIHRYQIATQDQILIICKERETVQDLYDDLGDIFGFVSFVTSKLLADHRKSAIQQFNNREIKILIITPSIKGLKSDSLTTVINFDHVVYQKGSTVDLDMMYYNKWINIIPNRKESLYINFVHEKYAEYVFKRIPKEFVVNKNQLLQLCSHGRS